MATARRRPLHPRGCLTVALALALLLPALVATPHIRAAGTCVVTGGGDSGAGTLRAAIDQTDGFANCDTITFQPGLATVTVTANLVIERAVTIQGPGAAVLAVQHSGPASGSGQVFLIAAGPVAIGGLTVRNGHSNTSTPGAGISIIGFGSHPTIALDGLVITGNTADAAGGGGLYVTNADVTVTNTTISGNTANSLSTGGGGILIDDALGVADATVTLTGCTVDGNVTTGFGGGIAVQGDHTGMSHLTATVVNSTISGNTANSGGGGGSTWGTLALTGSTVSSNRATTGGGISGYKGTVSLTNSTVSGNQASINGGGFGMVFGTVTLKYVTVIGNTADSDNDGNGSGGGIYSTNDTTVLSSIVAGNRKGPSTLDDCVGFVAGSSQGHNLWGDHTACPATGPDDQDLVTLDIGIAAVLNPILADNGGPTKTHTLVPGSPALDHGENVNCPAVIAADQRGVPRPQGTSCDAGAVEARVFTLTTGANGPGTVSPATSFYAQGSVATLMPQPQTGAIFTGWTVDNTFQGWAPSLTITMNANHNVVATFAAPPSFSDVPGNQPYSQPIAELAARGDINGYGDGTYGPGDLTLRAQMAALIARAMGYADSPANPFTDKCDPANPANCVDAELWNRVAELAARNVARGYTDAPTCAPSVVPCYAPRDFVLHAQVLSFITRAMEDKGYWTAQPTNAGLYGGVLTGTGHEQDVATFLFYTQTQGGVPDYPATGGFPAWDQAATRGWFARALWTALDSYWSVDRVP
jgi:hypothetical protein